MAAHAPFMSQFVKIMTVKLVPKIITDTGNFTQVFQIKIVNHFDFPDTFFSADPLCAAI